MSAPPSRNGSWRGDASTCLSVASFPKSGLRFRTVLENIVMGRVVKKILLRKLSHQYFGSANPVRVVQTDSVYKPACRREAPTGHSGTGGSGSVATCDDNTRTGISAGRGRRGGVGRGEAHLLAPARRCGAGIRGRVTLPG